MYSANNLSAFHSSEYDGKIKTVLPCYEEFHQQTLDVVQCGLGNRLHWLDVGCGTGKMAEAVSQNPEVRQKLARFVCCDCSLEMIKEAQRRVQLPQAEFLASPVQDLNFHQEFDVITAIQSLHYIRREERAAAEKKCFDALKKGGYWIHFENFAPFSEPGKKLSFRRWKAYQLSQGRSAGECALHASRYNREYFPLTLAEHLDRMRDCGFSAAEVLWVSYMQAGFLGIK